MNTPLYRSKICRGAIVGCACALVTVLLLPLPVFALSIFDRVGIDEVAGRAIPLNAPFIDADGKPVTLGSLARGKPLLLIPVMHNCPNICGVTLSGVVDAVEGQSLRPGTDFELIAFSIDPREGPGDAAAALKRLRDRDPVVAASHLHALTGSSASIGPLTAALGYRYAWDAAIGQYAHASATAVVTADGHLASWLYGLQPRPEDLRLALLQAGRGQLGGWTDQLILLCYHFDPHSGTYTPWIWTFLRVLAGLTVLVVGALVLRGLVRGSSPEAE